MQITVNEETHDLPFDVPSELGAVTRVCYWGKIITVFGENGTARWDDYLSIDKEEKSEYKELPIGRHGA